MTTLYRVDDLMQPSGILPRLVDAANNAQAIRHIASRYQARPVSAKEAASLVAQGVVVETAGDGKQAQLTLADQP